MNIKKMYMGFGVFSIGFFAALTLQAKPISFIDSIGVENKDGKEVVIHRLAAKETYYSLSRLYQLNPKDISSFNNARKLKIGDLVKIPTNRNFSAASKKASSNTINASAEYIEYKVGRGETLYNIAKRFQVSVESIIDFNNIKGNSIKLDQILKVPQGNTLRKVEATVDEIAPMENNEVAEKQFALPPDRYGLTQVSDKGIGVWIEDLNTDDGKMLALHKTAPVGTIIKITNPMSQRTTYAKVVGKYNDNNDTREAIIVISKATANLIGVIDKRFLVNISYGIPN